MSEYRDLSRLPDDDAYWAALESRITGELGPRIREGASDPGGAPVALGGARDARDVRVRDDAGWWAPLEQRAWRLAGLAIAAGLAAVLLLPRDPSPSSTDAAGTIALGPAAFLLPTDPALAAPLASARPPSIATLVLPAEGAPRE